MSLMGAYEGGFIYGINNTSIFQNKEDPRTKLVYVNSGNSVIRAFFCFITNLEHINMFLR